MKMQNNSAARGGGAKAPPKDEKTPPKGRRTPPLPQLKGDRWSTMTGPRYFGSARY